MGREFEHFSVPDSGDRLQYDADFESPESPIIPIIADSPDPLVSAARQVLDAASSLMGRTIHWMAIPAAALRETPRTSSYWQAAFDAFRHFRIGIIGSQIHPDQPTRISTSDFLREAGLDVTMHHHSKKWLAPSDQSSDWTAITIFWNHSEDSGAALEYGPDRSVTSSFRNLLLETGSDPSKIPTGPTGFGVRPHSARGTESTLDIAMDFALEHDRNTLTIAHQSDRFPRSEGSFQRWAHSTLDTEYGDAIIDEESFHDGPGGFPADEIIIRDRLTNTLVQELSSHPTEHDVIVAPAGAATLLSSLASEVLSTIDPAPSIRIGDGQLATVFNRTAHGKPRNVPTSPIAAFLSGCLLFDYIGWVDSATALRKAISAAIADVVSQRSLSTQAGQWKTTSLDTFTVAVLNRLATFEADPGSGGVRTTSGERQLIKHTIAGLYTLLFEDHLSPEEIELNQLLHADEEADVYLPEVGLNFEYWRQWSVERRMEVLLHELAHVDETAGERDHGDEFYARLVELTEIAADRSHALEDLFAEPIDFTQVSRYLIESVHEETIESDFDSVSARQTKLADQLGLGAKEYF